MKTAQDMYDFVKTNGYGEGMGWNLKHFKVIEKNLSIDEDVLFCFTGTRHDVQNKSSGYWAFAITNKRLMQGQQGLLGDKIQFVNLNNLNDVTKTTGLLGYITFDTIKERFKVGFSSVATNKVFEQINNILADFKNQSNTMAATQQISSADEIMKYKQLLDNGIITQEEFETKKKQLLGLK